MPVFPGFLEIIRVVIKLIILCGAKNIKKIKITAGEKSPTA